MKVGSILVFLSVLVCVLANLENRHSLRGQQKEPDAAQPASPAPARRDEPSKPEQAAKAEESKPARALCPAAFPYSSLSPFPVESIPPFSDKDFKVGVVAWVQFADAAKNTVLLSMGCDNRTVELDRNFRLYRVTRDDDRELDRKEIFAPNWKERCLVTLERRDGQDRITHFYAIGDVGGNQSDRKTKEQEYQKLICEWQQAFRTDAQQRVLKRGYALTPEQKKMGREVITTCERGLFLLGVDNGGKSASYHTRGGVKKVDLEQKLITLVLGEHERSWKIEKQTKVFVVTVKISPYGETFSGDSVVVSKLQPYSVVEAADGVARIRPDGQVYLTFEGGDEVRRIDILEQERLPPLALPDLSWLPYPLTDDARD